MWDLVWHDEFDGQAGSKPSQTKWTSETGGHGWGNQELQYYTDDVKNAACDGKGSLVVSAYPAAYENNRTYNCWYGPASFTSARLVTAKKFEFRYGLVEARIKIPHGKGGWPAFWLIGANIDETSWPVCGEIDIMENVGRDPDRVWGSLHCASLHGSNALRSSFSLSNVTDSSDGYHLFAMSWTRDRIQWYVDGAPYFIVTRSDVPAENDWAFDRDFYIVLNLAIGGEWAGTPDKDTTFPLQMMVDYVRVYQTYTNGDERHVIRMSRSTSDRIRYAPPEYNRPEVRGRFFHSFLPQHGVGAEIGVHRGSNVNTLRESAQPTQLHLIDPWYLLGKEWQWGQGDRSTMNALIGVLQTFEQELVEQAIVLHVGFDTGILPMFPDQYFDWVYLDTSHRYDDTCRELELLQVKVKADGIIAGDDWHVDPAHLHHGVCKAVRQFVEREPYEICYAEDADKQWAIRRRK